MEESPTPGAESATLEATVTATTDNSSSGTSKRSREDEDDDASGPSTKILKSSDDSDPPSEEELQAIAAARNALMKTSAMEENNGKGTEDESAAVPVVASGSSPVETDTGMNGGTSNTNEANATSSQPEVEPQETETPPESLAENPAPTTAGEAPKQPPQDASTPEVTVGVNGTDPKPHAEPPAQTAESFSVAEPSQTESTTAGTSVVVPLPVDSSSSTTTPVPPPVVEETAPVPPPAVEQQAPPVVPGLPTGDGMPVNDGAPAHPQQSGDNPHPQSYPQQQQPDYVEESGQIAALYVGRVIGKGGEMIRDLQARSGAKMDVDSNVPPGQPRTITYAGTRAQVDFAKQLVQMLHQNVPEESLPLGHARQELISIPATGVGKVIGRGGEMIRELQSRSQAKIQVDHSGAAGLPAHEKQVSVTGTAEAVAKAKEMVLFLVNNPMMEAQQSLNMLVEEKRSGASAWGSGPPYPNMPNQGMNMQPPTAMAPVDPYGGGGDPYGGAYGHQQQAAYQQQMPPMQQHPQQMPHQQPRSDGAETMYAPKQFMGRIIGSKGVTINDLQQRSGTHIQINQEVSGADSEITITGPPNGIRAAKSMIQEILAAGPNHPYAGGGGGGGGMSAGGNPYVNPGAMPGYGGGYHGGAGYPGAGVGYHGGHAGMMAPYGGGYPPQQQSHHPQYGGYADPSNMGYGGYGAAAASADPYSGSSAGAPGPYSAPAGYGAQAPYQATYGGADTRYGGPTATTGPYGAYPDSQAAPYGGSGAAAYGGPAYGMPAPAPPAASSAGPWKMATSADGQVYYYNEQTGHTQWEKPQGM